MNLLMKFWLICESEEQVQFSFRLRAMGFRAVLEWPQWLGNFHVCLQWHS